MERHRRRDLRTAVRLTHHLWLWYRRYWVMKDRWLAGRPTLSPAIMVQEVLGDGGRQVKFLEPGQPRLPHCLPDHTSAQVHQR